MEIGNKVKIVESPDKTIPPSSYLKKRGEIVDIKGGVVYVVFHKGRYNQTEAPFYPSEIEVIK